MKNVRRCLSFLLALIMLAGFMSGSALAGPEDNSDLIQNSDNQQEVHTDPPAGNDSGSEGKNLGGGDTGGQNPDPSGSGAGGQEQNPVTTKDQQTPSASSDASSNNNKEETPAPGTETSKDENPGSEGAGSPSGPKENAPAPGSAGDQGGDDNSGEEDDEEDVDFDPARLGLRYEGAVEYILEPVSDGVYLEDLGIVFRNWGAVENSRYYGKLAEVRARENDVLGASMRNANGEMFVFNGLVEFALSCGAWEGKSLEELNAMEFSLYLTNGYGELGEAQTVFRIWNGHPALFFSNDRLGDLLLTQANEAERARLAAEREEQARIEAEKANQEQESALGKEKTTEKTGDLQDNSKVSENTGLIEKDEVKEEVKEEIKEEVKEEVQEEPEEEINYIPQESSLNGATVKALIPEGALNEYAKLSVTTLNDDMEDIIREHIITKANGSADGANMQIASMVLLNIGFAAGEVDHYPSAPVILTIQSDDIKWMSSPRIYHVLNDVTEDLTDAETTAINIQEGTVTFVANGFSPFAVADLADEEAVTSQENPVEVPAEQVVITEADDAVIRQAAEALGLKNTDAAQEETPEALPAPGRRTLKIAKPEALPAAEENVPATKSGYVGLDISVDESILSEGAQYKVPVKLPEPINLTGAENTVIDSLTVKAYHIVDGAAQEVKCVCPDDVKETGVLSELCILTDGFSPYLVSYTVEFHNGDKEVVIEGGSQIFLSTLITELGLTHEDGSSFTVDDVAGVEFITEGLFNVEEVAGGSEVTLNRGTEQVQTVTVSTEHDFVLTSQKPFDEVEMKLTFKDRTTLEVHVTDAENALTVNVNLYDYDDSTKIAFPSTFGGDDHVYMFVWDDSPDAEDNPIDFKNLPDNRPWACVDITAIKGENSPYSVDVANFNTKAWGGDPVTYSSLNDAQKSNLKVRVIHTSSSETPSLGSLKNKAQYSQSEFDELWNGGFEGYEMSKSHTTGLISTRNYEVNFKMGDTHEQAVILEFDPEEDKGAIPAGKSYVLLDATSFDGNNHYYYVVEATTDGSEATVVLPLEGNWSSGQKFSNNWQSITGSVIVPKAGKTISPGGNKPESSDYTTSYMMGDYLYSYQRETRTDQQEHIQWNAFVFKLQSPNLDPAIDPYDVLGEGAEYGVIANEYERLQHTETNFAVNKYVESTEAGIDLAANGGESEAMPFYVGEYNHIRFTSNVTVDPDIHTPSERAASYVHKEADEADDHIHQDGTGYDVTVIPTSPDAVNAYVNGLISKLTSSSETYSGKTQIKAQPGKVLDTTSLPDNVTIYVDATDLNVHDAGWEIKKLEGQSIVLNIPGSDVLISKEYVSVYSKDESGNLTPVKENIDSNTGGGGGSEAHNADVENYILNHIVLNAYEATSVKFKDGPAGLFLAPNANFEEVNGSGTGWVATGKKFLQTGSEWHFFRTQRKYKAEGDLSLSGAKNIMKADGTPMDYSEFSSLTFTFDLFASDENGTIAEGATALYTVTADSSGKFAFNKLHYTQAEVPADTTKTFYYVIQEQKCDKTDGVSYNAAPVLVKVAVTDASGKISFNVSTSNDGGSSWGDSISPSEGTIPVYAIGGFTNTYEETSETGSLTITKSWAGDTASLTDEYKNAIQFSVTGPNSYSTNFTFADMTNGSKTLENLALGDYTVTETNTDLPGYAVTTTYKVGDEATGTAVVTTSGATVNVTNNYNKQEGSLTVTKTWTGDDAKLTDAQKNAVTFTVSGPNNYSTSFTYADMTSGSKTLEHLALGEYTVTESSNTVTGFTITAKYEVGENETNKVTIADGDNKTIAVTNTVTEQKSGLTITKTWTGDTASLTNEYKNAIKFTITGPDNFSEEVLYSAFSNGSYTINNLPLGTYTVTESNTAIAGYTVTTTYKVGTEGTENTGSRASATVGTAGITVAFTNNYKATETTATLQATKEFNDWSKANSFTFNLAAVTAGAPMPASTTATATATVKTATFGAITYKTAGIYEYTITEVNDGVPGVTYDTTPHKVTVTVTSGTDGKLTATVKYDGKDSLTVTNTYKSGFLVIEKTVTGNLADKNKYFTFKITLNVDGNYPYEVSNGKTGTIRSGGTIQLKHGESVIIRDLPAGCKYQVTESDSYGYRTYSSGDSGRIGGGSTSTAGFINSRSTAPATGERDYLNLSLSTMLLSGLGMIATFFSGRKRKEKMRRQK